MNERTAAYWPTRALLAIGFLATIIAVTMSLEGLTQATELRFSAGPDVLGLPVQKLFALAGLVPVLGFAWMLRIFRGRRGEPPAWRYRDR
jgi:hypothetical protein